MASNPAIVPSEAIPSVRPDTLRAPHAAALAAVLAVLGVASIWPTAIILKQLWMSDPLRSIGMLMPVVSFLLVLRAWRSIGWEMDGSWWGLVLIAVTAVVVQLRDQALFLLVLWPACSISLPPPSVAAFAYASGVVLLFGGPRLFRAALFPLALLWFVNPVPRMFNLLVDLPLQHASAHVARSFAMALGQPLTPDQLRLMFTPKFGMFIAPGCNGIRGSVTMGLIALIAGSFRRFRWYIHAAVVAGAVLLGYVFNFLRLCLLVVYYLIALHIHWLQSRATMGDYIIGGSLFLLGTIFLCYAILGLSTEQEPLGNFSSRTPYNSRPGGGFLLRAAALLVIAFLGCYQVAHAYTRSHSAEILKQQADQQSTTGTFPATLGTYTLSRTWNEKLTSGVVLYHWAQYLSADHTSSVAVGVDVGLPGTHESLMCHVARGDDPLWRNQLTLPTEGGVPVSFSGAIFSDGVTQTLDATTICTGSSCGEYTDDRTHFGLVYSRVDARSLLGQHTRRPIPILLRVESVDSMLAKNDAPQILTAALRNFVASVNLEKLTEPYRQY